VAQGAGEVPEGGRGLAIGILTGAFDPLTVAHGALARAALDAGGLDAIYLALSRRTVEKEGLARPGQADRTLVLRLYARRRDRHGVLLFNRGLYVEQARAARAAFPTARAIRFVVGFDKARQIFDPRYYDDRDAALRALFAAATLLVAPRAGDGAVALAALLDRPENRPFRDAVRPLPFDPAWADASSTVVREAARAGLPVGSLVPPEAAAFIAEARPYDPPSDAGAGVDAAARDRYALREALIAALGGDRAWAEERADLRALLRLAGSTTEVGRVLRAWLAAPAGERSPATPRALLATLAPASAEG
jgi:nicotinic acid mononucleotide adenylyltransferase